MLEPEVQLLGAIEIPPLEPTPEAGSPDRVERRRQRARRRTSAHGARRRPADACPSRLRGVDLAPAPPGGRLGGRWSLSPGSLYVGARETSVFAVRRSTSRGAADGSRAGSARRRSNRSTATSLVALTSDEVERRARSSSGRPSAAELDRTFPGTLRVSVRLERPVAVVRQGEDAWLVARARRVLRGATVGELPGLPRDLARRCGADDRPRSCPGQERGAPRSARSPRSHPFPGRGALGARIADELPLVVGARTELRLGEAVDLRLKLEVAAGGASRPEPRASGIALAYLDVSLPTGRLAADKSQVES